MHAPVLVLSKFFLFSYASSFSLSSSFLNNFFFLLFIDFKWFVFVRFDFVEDSLKRESGSKVRYAMASQKVYIAL